MNDPGLDDPISQNANAVEKERNESAAAEEDMAFLNPRSLCSSIVEIITAYTDSSSVVGGSLLLPFPCLPYAQSPPDLFKACIDKVNRARSVLWRVPSISAP